MRLVGGCASRLPRKVGTLASAMGERKPCQAHHESIPQTTSPTLHSDHVANWPTIPTLTRRPARSWPPAAGRRPSQMGSLHVTAIAGQPLMSRGMVSAMRTVSPHSAGAEPRVWSRRAATRCASAWLRVIHQGLVRASSR